MTQKSNALRLADELTKPLALRRQFLPEEASAELRRLHAENEALRADAERYRWLRSDDIEVPLDQREISVVMHRFPFSDQPDETLTESALDAAIDAAIAKVGEQK